MAIKLQLAALKPPRFALQLQQQSLYRLSRARTNLYLPGAIQAQWNGQFTQAPALLFWKDKATFSCRAEQTLHTCQQIKEGKVVYGTREAPLLIGRSGSFREIRWVAHNQIELQAGFYGKFLKRGFRDYQPVFPGRNAEIFGGTNHRTWVNVYGANMYARPRPLCQHERDEPGSCANVQNSASPFHIRPSAQQHAIRANGVHHIFLENAKSFEMEGRKIHARSG